MNKNKYISTGGPMARLIPFFLILYVLSNWNALAQVPENIQPKSTASSSTKAVVFKGELGTFGELYNMSGIAPRRPGSTGRLFLRSTLTAWNSVSISLNLVLSSEGSSARQNINQLDFNPKWSWGQAHLGDFCEEFTPLTLSGVKVRGGGFSLEPGKWRLAMISGMTTRSVETNNSRRSYERSINGGKIGYGNSNGSFFDFYILNARDRISSLAEIPVDTTTAEDTLMNYEQNPLTVTPQENLVISTVTNLTLFKNKLKWKSEVGVAAITRDRRSAELDNSGVPEFLTNLFTPRKSSGVDYAYTSDMNLDLSKSSFNIGYHYIGPGYVSLGLASLISDKKEITAGVSHRFKSGMFRIDGAIQQDNLIHQKTYTTDRSRISTFLSYRLRQNWNITANAMFIGMSNDSRSDTTRLDYSGWIFRTGQNLTFGRQTGLRSLSVDLSYQMASDKNQLRKSANTKSGSIGLSTSYVVNRSLEFVPSIALISTRAGDAKRTLTQTYSVSGRHKALQQRLNTNVTMAVSVANFSTTLHPSLKSIYDLGKNYSISAEFESTFVRGGAPSSQFDEIAGRLMLTRRF